MALKAGGRILLVAFTLPSCPPCWEGGQQTKKQRKHMLITSSDVAMPLPSRLDFLLVRHDLLPKLMSFRIEIRQEILHGNGTTEGRC